MGGLEAEGAVRYVSPVTARLFSKEGSAALGLPGEVLVPLEEASPVWGRHRPTTSQQIPQQQRGIMTTNPQGGGDGAFIINSAYHQSAPMDDEDETSPQSCFEAILTERGYDCSPRSSASEGCRCAPTQKQIDDYQIPLVDAVRRGDLCTLEALAASGVDMGASNRFGESIVHLATRRGSAPVLQFLLAHNASVRICDDYGKTPMHDAFWTAEPRFDLVSMMLDVDWRLLRAADIRGATPLRYAKKKNWRVWCAFLDHVKDRHWPSLPPEEREI